MKHHKQQTHHSKKKERKKENIPFWMKSTTFVDVVVPVVVSVPWIVSLAAVSLSSVASG
jgi:hypothetical protein